MTADGLHVRLRVPPLGMLRPSRARGHVSAPRWIGPMRLVKLPRGWALSLTSPVIVHHPNPKNWKCSICRRFWRIDQTDRYGRCPKCGGSVRREVSEH